MKKKIICTVIILILMTTIPVFTVKNNNSLNNATPAPVLYTKEDIYGYVSNEFKPKYHIETLKAIAIILQSNYSFNKECPAKSFMSKTDFENKYGDKAEKYYNKIKNAVDEVFNIVIVHNNNIIHIPYSYTTKKNASKKYPYLKNSATPWDLIDKEYNEKNNTGVSINSMNELCKNGMSYKEVLNYFLTDIALTEKAPQSDH